MKKILSACLLAAALVGVPAAQAQQVWFAPGDNLAVNGVVNHPDFMQLFTNPAAWPVSAAKTNVLMMRAPWFSKQPAADVQTVLAFLTAHNIKLAIHIGVLTNGVCGQGIEGFLRAGDLAKYMTKMQSLGADLAFVVMDEPNYYGHDYVGAGSCNWATADIADNAAASVQTIRQTFPSAQIMLVEPMQGLSGGVSELQAFMDEYYAKLGEYPKAVRFDVQWNKPSPTWQATYPAFIQYIQSIRSHYGIIYNATQGGSQPNDAAWIASAKANVAAWGAAIHATPGHVVIQTWDPMPVVITPETDPATMSGYLNWFVSRTLP